MDYILKKIKNKYINKIKIKQTKNKIKNEQINK